LHRRHANYARAEALFQRGLAIREAALGKDHPAVATSLNNLADVYIMYHFEFLLAGHGRVAALREAMLALRAQQPHPYHWAPFIAAGRDAPLRGLGPTAP
jgi:tetratricopeptide repeat protein/CHAT domain-containing protein